MAIWGAPIDDEDHAAKAVRASIEMMNQLKASQADFAARGLPVIEIGIGINTGMVSVGNFGSRERFDYTVMGDNVNLASRLEGLNKDYGPNIIISEFTKAALGERFFCRIVDKVQVKGKNKAVVIYEPLVEGEPDEALRREVEVFENEAGGWSIIDVAEGADILILVDAVLDRNLKPGRVKWYSPGDIFSSVRLSGPHNMDIFSSLDLARKYNLKIPEDVYILGVGTKDINTFSEECTKEAEPGIERGTQAVVSKLLELFPAI